MGISKTNSCLSEKYGAKDRCGVNKFVIRFLFVSKEDLKFIDRSGEPGGRVV